jgi:hypothetical protein
VPAKFLKQVIRGQFNLDRYFHFLKALAVFFTAVILVFEYEYFGVSKENDGTAMRQSCFAKASYNEN